MIAGKNLENGTGNIYARAVRFNSKFPAVFQQYRVEVNHMVIICWKTAGNYRKSAGENLG